jgi:hypothetical protein
VPARVLTVEEDRFNARTRQLASPITAYVPVESKSMVRGLLKVLDRAAPFAAPCVQEEPLQTPATVVTANVIRFSLRIAWLDKSAMSAKDPSGVMAIPYGVLKLALVPTVLSTHPAVPVPATTTAACENPRANVIFLITCWELLHTSVYDPSGETTD